MNEAEIRRLGKRFRKLDKDGSGTLSVHEFMQLSELQQNPLVERVIDIFDTDGDGEIDFQGICQRAVPPPACRARRLPAPASAAAASSWAPEGTRVAAPGRLKS